MKFRTFTVALLLLILCFLTYWRVLFHQFMIDDFYYIAEAIERIHFHTLGDFFMKSINQHYEPATNFVLVSLFRLFKEPLYLYLTGLILFYFNALGIFIFVRLITKNQDLALLTSVLFCIHPMSAEIVNHISLLNITFISILFLSCLILVWLYLENHKRRYLGIMSLMLYVLALLTQELALSFPLYLILLLFYLKRFSFKEIMKWSVPFLVLSAAFLFVWLVFSGKNAKLLERMATTHMNLWNYPVNFLRLINWYVFNLFFPNSIVFMFNIKPIQTFLGIWNIIFLGGVIAVVFIFKKYIKDNIVKFALSMFLVGFIFMIPLTLSRPRTGLVIQPYWLYFSSIGFFLLLSMGLLKLGQHLKRNIFIGLMSVIFLFFSVQTQRLNAIADTELGYTENWLRKSPGNVIPMAILGTIYSYTPGSKIPVDFMPAMSDLLKIYFQTSTYQRALDLLTKMIASDPGHPNNVMLLAQQIVLAYKLDHKQDAEKLESIFRERYPSPSGFMELANAFGSLQMEGQAVDVLDQCLHTYPHYKEAYLFRGVLLANQGRYQEAIDIWQKGRDLDSDDQQFLTNIHQAEKLLKNLK